MLRSISPASWTGIPRLRSDAANSYGQNRPRGFIICLYHSHEVIMLAAALGFNDDDLQANRAGRLTVRQRNRVYGLRYTLIIALAVVTAVIGLIAAVVIVAVLVGAAISPVAILLALGGEVITAGLAYWAWSLWQNYRTYLLPGRVQQVKGTVTVYQLRERQDERRKTVYYLRIDPLEFPISDEGLNAFTDGARYVVYYVPQPLTLLSAEPADSDSPDTAARVQS
jgi:hypothetical protein